MKEEKNKKVIVIGIVSALLLIVAIVGTTYAVFTANLTGTKENKLTTGYVTMTCNETNFSLNNTKPLSDSEGIALNNNEATCTLSTTLSGTMRIGYDVALYNVTPSATLTTSDVKIRASKTDNGTTSYVAGSSIDSGVLISSIASTGGQYDTSITGYKIDSGVITQTKTIVYNVKSWVASEQDSENTTANTNGYCSDETYTTEAECKQAGEVWGYNQKAGRSGGDFSFKIKVGAKQIYS